jgi:hypothetical protein
MHICAHPNTKKHFHLSLTICFFLFLFQNVSGQVSIEGKIASTSSEGIPFANVLLLNPTDSALIRGGLTDEFGNYSFEMIEDGEYIVGSSYIGYNTYYSEPMEVKGPSEINLEVIILSEGVTLDQVQVVAKKPLYEQKIDRLVVNVSNSITSAGSTALEVLERSPGVLVNQQSNSISLIGKAGVVIMINGRISYQPAESVVRMLAGMSADNIESIELITTPPANLDAEGNAGYINIVLKQRTDVGLNGNATASVGYGNGETGAAGADLNYRSGIVNIFANYNFSLQAQKQLLKNNRLITSGSNSLRTDFIADRDPQQVSHNLRIGADFQISSKTVVGILLSAYDNNWTMDAETNSETFINGQVNNSSILRNDEINHWQHYGANFNIAQKIGTSGKLNLNLDYLNYKDNNPTNYNIQYFDANNNLSLEENTRSSKLTPINITVGQFDYSNAINDKVNLTTGIKWAHSGFINTVGLELLENGAWDFVDEFTNESDLQEDIRAAFASLDYNMDEKNTFKLGLRYEYTDSKLNTDKEGTVVDRQFGVLFPSLFYSRVLNENQSVNLSYSKRITRPTFNDMAPFAIFLDPNTYILGNSSLQPAISNNYKIDYRYKSYVLSIQYSKEDSTIAEFQDLVNVENDRQLLGPENLSSTTLYSASLSVPMYFGNKYTIQNNFILVNGTVRSYFEARLIEQSITSFNLNTTHSFAINGNHSLEASGFYNSPTLQGRFKQSAIYGIIIGFQKQFKNGSSLRLNVRDLLNSIEFNGTTDIPSEGFRTERVLDFSNRTYSISYSFTFGNSKLQGARARATGSEEERNRVN